ncbi:hypothetical protein FM107_09690 [Sphingobacterium sp. JB170]|nr:hypothetical protein FM107_09690 [Sphingobacterium sp. JB170]
MGLYIQYGIIGVIFIIALFFIIKKVIPSNKNGGCSKGCGCGIALPDDQKR